MKRMKSRRPMKQRGLRGLSPWVPVGPEVDDSEGKAAIAKPPGRRLPMGVCASGGKRGRRIMESRHLGGYQSLALLTVGLYLV